MGRGSPCPSVLHFVLPFGPETSGSKEDLSIEGRPQGRRKTQCRRKIFGIEGHLEGEIKGVRLWLNFMLARMIDSQ